MAGKLTLEQSFERLDSIIQELQEGELTLEQSFQKYEEGMKMIKNCTAAIDKVEKKLEIMENEE
ncbi:MAG: exodeoxyribonuclease VII small subunit [Lachnospiraceae bacterium]|nr:exodeoxyribonuclease VII small subunit [Lachnospiraceae bacterium]